MAGVGWWTMDRNFWSKRTMGARSSCGPSQLTGLFVDPYSAPVDRFGEGLVQGADPADTFDALIGTRSSGHGVANGFELVVGPRQSLPTSVSAGDYLLYRALGEGRLAGFFALTSNEIAYEVASGGAGWFVQVRGGRRMKLAGPDGRVERDRMIVRVRRAPSESWLQPCRDCGRTGEDVEAVEAVETSPHTCQPGEGPPAAEPDPSGRGPHPLIKEGTTRTHSRRPSVGHAQQRLNEFLAQYQAGTFACRDTSASTQSYVRARLAELRTAGQLPLAVDCRFGLNTKRATQAFQACMRIDRDGQIGPITWPLLDAVGLTVGATAAFRMRVDGNRDGTVDTTPAPTAWTWGPAGAGAMVLVNNDDDGVRGHPDNEDDHIDSGTDNTEIAPLVVESTGPVPAGTLLEIIVDRPDAIRIFASTSAGAREIVGPRTSGTHRFASLPSPSITLGMEGVRYAGTGFDGLVTITLRTTPPSGAPTEVRTVVRVAPWMMPSHMARAEKVFVLNGDSFNSTFRGRLRTLVTAAGCSLDEFRPSPRHLDVWMQDCMEFGFSNLPTTGFRTVVRSPRNESLQTFPRTLLDNDLGYVEIGSLATSNTLNSSGNLEVSPPVTVGSKNYPHGRIYFGRARTRRRPSGLTSLEQIDPDLEQFLRAQVVQAPFNIDTGWLMVAHVDEVVSFVPATGGKGFRLLIASTSLAYRLLDALVLTNPTDKVMVGRQFPVSSSSTPFSAEMTIRDFLALRDDFHPDLQDLITSLPGAHTPRPLRDYNRDRQADLDRIKATMMTELNLVEADIIEVPAVFMPNPHIPAHADALFAGMVNMLVINNHCVVPDPFGPMVGGSDQFQADLRGKLTPLGLTVNFLDCWDTYHVALGEVHCGTNTLRQYTNARWWEFQP
jgi:hypothetical protein